MNIATGISFKKLISKNKNYVVQFQGTTPVNTV